MENLGQYILSVITAAMICGIAGALVPSEQGKRWIRLLCGMILTMTVIRPALELTHIQIPLLDTSLWSDGQEIALDAEKQTQDSMAELIKQQTEAYILDKAASIGISIQASIETRGDNIPVPFSAEIEGTVSPYQKLRLESWIQEDLGITKENIQWKESIKSPTGS